MRTMRAIKEGYSIRYRKNGKWMWHRTQNGSRLVIHNIDECVKFAQTIYRHERDIDRCNVISNATKMRMVEMGCLYG